MSARQFYEWSIIETWTHVSSFLQKTISALTNIPYLGGGVLVIVLVSIFVVIIPALPKVSWDYSQTRKHLEPDDWG